MSLVSSTLFLLLSLVPASGKSAPLGDCTDCSYTPSTTALCAQHEEREREVLSEAKREFKQVDPRDRRRALKKAAMLTKSHAAAPSRDVAKFLAEGLEDDDLTVREESLELLLEGQHPDETVKALMSAWKQAKKGLDKYKSDLKLTEKYKGQFSKKSTAVFDKIRSFPADLSYAVKLLGSIGALPDKRCEAQLISLLEESLPKANALLDLAAAGGLLNLGSYEGLEAVIEFQEDLASLLTRKKIPARYGQSGSPSVLDLWLSMDRELRETDFDRIALALGEAVQAKGVAKFPGPGLDDAEEWKNWFKEHGATHWKPLPEDVPVLERVPAVPLVEVDISALPK